MTGQRYIEIVDPIREQKGIKKGAFCRAIGVHPNMYGNYRNGAVPSYAVIEATEKYLGIRFADYEKCEEEAEETDELTELLEELRNREDMRMLFKLAKGATPDDVRQAVKIIEALRK
jgi:transcriptional regulator with XRE-family HTH domain